MGNIFFIMNKYIYITFNSLYLLSRSLVRKIANTKKNPY